LNRKEKYASQSPQDTFAKTHEQKPNSANPQEDRTNNQKKHP